MKIKEIGHLAFVCSDLERSIDFYQNKLGFYNKFTIYYRDMYEHVKDSDTVSPEWLSTLEKRKDEKWIAYFEFGDGQFFELFNPEGATEFALTGGNKLNYSHVALVVEDIHAAYEELKAKDVPVDTPPSLGLEHTWQMWAHDPDGNRIEFMQYTPQSWQLTGH